MNIKNRINNINDAIQTLEKEREFVRNEICKHPKIVIKWWSDYPGHRYEADVCENCGKNLGCTNND